ncbi:MAG: group III truncated hemoglobin [Acidobacteriota bacterium]
MSRPDLDSPERLETFVRAFYERVQRDDLLGPVFVDQAGVDWDEHITKLTAFWCAVELRIPGFHGSPTQKHSVLSQQMPFRAEQFGRWIELFRETVDQSWQGPHATSIKAHAERIAQIQSRVVQGAEAWE